MSKIEILPVELGNRSYNIVVGEDLLSNAGEYIKQVITEPSVCIITDDNVGPLHVKKLELTLQENQIEYSLITLKSGEQTKSFEDLGVLLDQLLATKPSRNTTLIALGGGVIGDIVGFAASILLRGISFIQIPTTLLAQVDSSVGGKTGINTDFGKNLVGSFYQPKLVLADISLLSSLPKRDFLSGYAEVVKYGLIADEDFFNWLESNKQDILNKESHKLTHAIITSCKVKAEIVAADEQEKGQRALLNLGHTFGHALETATGYSDKLLHGEAVSIGMVLAFNLSAKLGFCDRNQAQKVLQHLAEIGLPTKPTDIMANWDVDQLINSMYQDKKATKKSLVFILVNKIGQAFIEKNVDPEKVAKVLEESL